jgi:hypothetical protein
VTQATFTDGGRFFLEDFIFKPFAVAGQRWTIEDGFETAENELGLDQQLLNPPRWGYGIDLARTSVLSFT